MILMFWVGLALFCVGVSILLYLLLEMLFDA